MARARRSPLAGAEPLSPRRKWRAITLATLVLAPAYWAILAGLVSIASDRNDAPAAGPFIAFGLALVPFVFVVLAFLSEQPRASTAVVKAMGLTLLIGIPISALAADAVTGLVAGVGAGGIVALRREVTQPLRPRVIAILVAAGYTFMLLRVAPAAAIFAGPILPFTSLGVADHVAELRRQRAAPAGSVPRPKRGR